MTKQSIRGITGKNKARRTIHCEADVLDIHLLHCQADVTKIDSLQCLVQKLFIHLLIARTIVTFARLFAHTFDDF